MLQGLIQVANEVFDMDARCNRLLEQSPQLLAMALNEQLDHYLTLAAVAIDQCERRVLICVALNCT